MVAGIERARGGERVADHQHGLWVEPIESIDVVVAHSMGLGDDDKQMGAVEPLKAPRSVGAEADDKCAFVQFPAGRLEQPPTQPSGQRRVVIGRSEFVEYNVIDLAVGRASDNHLGGIVGSRPPEGQPSRQPVLPRAVTAHHRDPPRGS